MMKTGNTDTRLSAAEQAEMLEHLQRLLQAIENGLTAGEAQQFLHVPSGRRVRIVSGRIENNCSLILGAAGKEMDNG
jgi:hypothetical protein